MLKARPSAFEAAVVLVFSSLTYVGCGTAPAEGPAVSSVPFESSVDIDLSSSSQINPNAQLTVSNQGHDSIVMPAVVVKGSSALNRSSILFPLQGLKDEQLGVATWQFVSDHARHYCNAGSPGDNNLDPWGDPAGYSWEPMRLLNGYGDVCCDQRAMLLVWLWQGAGYPARLVWMNFHEVAEIFYAGAWHMFDGDHQVYYLKLDNSTVASVADLIANPDLVARVHDANGNDPIGYSAQWMASAYAAATPHYLTVDYKVQQIFVLHPGQTLTFNYAEMGSIFHGNLSAADAEPGDPPASSGSFDWSLDYAKPNWRSLATAENAVATVSDGSSVFLSNSTAASGSAVYSLSSPFPVIGLQVNAVVALAGPHSAVKAYFSTDGTSWSPAFPLSLTGTASAESSADLSSVAAGQYSYLVKLEMSGDGPNAARTANVHIVSAIQDSTFVFPALVPGQVNHFDLPGLELAQS